MFSRNNVRRNAALGAIALTLLAISPAYSQLAPPRPLVGPPIIIGADYDFEAMARRSSAIYAADVEGRGGTWITVQARLTDRRDGYPLRNQPIYASISSRGHAQTGFTNGQYIGEYRTNSNGWITFRIRPNQVTTTRTVTIRLNFNGSQAHSPSTELVRVRVRP
ncbi:MAG TPA: hypothetical protein PLL78_10485 [Fimbriimonadaceae bacterium]|nr:hypothetical protein [Fimbriimonadaceae bacterium]HRJ97102.1 hypothetical protein [Fimbriimonadaceae bacterium]